MDDKQHQSITPKEYHVPTANGTVEEEGREDIIYVDDEDDESCRTATTTATVVSSVSTQNDSSVTTAPSTTEGGGSLIEIDRPQSAAYSYAERVFRHCKVTTKYSLCEISLTPLA